MGPFEQHLALRRTGHREQAVAGIVERLVIDTLPGEAKDLLALDARALADQTHGFGTDAGDAVVASEVAAADGHIEGR